MEMVKQDQFLAVVILIFFHCMSMIMSNGDISGCISQTNISSMFIENGVLDLVPFSSKPPSYQCNCTNGSVYYWESVNESIPYTDFYINNIAYSIQATNACQLRVCTEDGLCYTPTNNNSYNFNFVPYCEDQSCHMYGIVYQQPFFKEDTVIDSNGKSYQSPLPYLYPLGETSDYLKVVSISCNGCSNILSSKTCSNPSIYHSNYTNYLNTDFSSLFTPAQTIPIVISFFIIVVFSSIPYVMVLYVIVKKKEFWESDVYKLIFHLGLFTMTDIWIRIYYASTWGFWYGAISRRFLIATLNFISLGITILTFALALNRWDVLASPKKLKSVISRSVFYIVRIIIILSYLLGLTMLIWQSLPGWGRFMLNIQTAKGPQYIQVREYKGLDAIFIQTDIEQGLMVFSLILYLWCLIDIIYQRLISKSKVAKKELLLFIQTLSPCLVRIGANVLTMIYTSGEPWFFIVTSMMWLLESCHYPFLYISLNKSIRNSIRVVIFKKKSPVVIATAVTVINIRRDVSKL